MQLTEGSAVLVLTEHGPDDVWDNEYREGPTDWRVQCKCGETEYTLEQFAEHQAANLALVAEVVQETIAERPSVDQRNADLAELYSAGVEAGHRIAGRDAAALERVRVLAEEWEAVAARGDQWPAPSSVYKHHAGLLRVALTRPSDPAAAVEQARS